MNVFRRIYWLLKIPFCYIMTLLWKRNQSVRKCWTWLCFSGTVEVKSCWIIKLVFSYFNFLLSLIVAVSLVCRKEEFFVILLQLKHYFVFNAIFYNKQDSLITIHCDPKSWRLIEARHLANAEFDDCFIQWFSHRPPMPSKPR